MKSGLAILANVANVKERRLSSLYAVAHLSQTCNEVTLEKSTSSSLGSSGYTIQGIVEMASYVRFVYLELVHFVDLLN